jgi:hypothetical protein
MAETHNTTTDCLTSQKQTTFYCLMAETHNTTTDCLTSQKQMTFTA